MSLPRKRKRLSENQTQDENRQTGQSRKRSSKNSSRKVTARTRQMQKAFEIVDHIEHVHDKSKPETPALDTRETSTPDEIRMRVTLGPVTTEKQAAETVSESSPPPVIEVKLTIPSFLWKVPVLGGVARGLIRKFSKDQA